MKSSARPRSAVRARRINLGIVLAAILIGVLASVRPWRMAMELRDQTRKTEAQALAAEKKQVDLAEEQVRREGPAGMERSARERGYHKPGETQLSER